MTEGTVMVVGAEADCMRRRDGAVSGGEHKLDGVKRRCC